MNLGWKVLFPIAVANLIIISAAILVLQNYGYFKA
jgi:NADH:ubiquinone oxidoreductase subunit H